MVLEGDCRFEVGGTTIDVSEGDVFVVPPDVDHGVEPTTDEPCRLLFTGPLRKDYLPHTEYQPEFYGRDGA